MKQYLFIFLFFIPLSVFAQSEIGIGLSGNYATQRPSGIDVVSSGGGLFYYAYSLNLVNAWSVMPQVQLVGSRYIMDGIFLKSPNGYGFEVTPAN